MLDLTDQEITDAYEQHAPEMLMTWCFKLKEERDRYREIAERAKCVEFYSTENVEKQLKRVIQNIAMVNKILRRVDKENRADQLWCCVYIIEGVLEELQVEDWHE